ncbi:recombinase family protein [Grimontia hollisae]|uniref:recombinase family protein n=1 Tax=Grimontia hollisae TaxID=673 RepID=UPI0013036AA7|nr:recombinase family protein [Grimontia hollisae]
MANVAYFRVSTTDQSIESQREEAKGRVFDRVYADEGISGTIPAMQRPQFKAMFDYLREGDELWVYDVDRLGRDSIDIQMTVKALKEKGVCVFVKSLGMDLTSEAAELVMMMCSKLAEMERNKILARTEAGREAAKASGKHMGRPRITCIEDVATLRGQGKSISDTASALGISVATVKRLTAKAKAQNLIP